MQFADKKESAWIKPEMGHHSIAIVGLIASPPVRRRASGVGVDRIVAPGFQGLSHLLRKLLLFHAYFSCVIPII